MSTYAKIFDNMVYVLSQFSQSHKALNTHEVASQLNINLRTAQRITKSLTELGWLEFKSVNKCKLYFASEKTKKFFGGAK